MNSDFSDWNIEAELPVSHQKKSFGLDHELVELLWENGQVVLHSQTYRKPTVYDPIDSRQVNKNDHHQSSLSSSSRSQITGSCGNPTSLIHDNDTVSWINCQIDTAVTTTDDDNPFEKHFSSNFLSNDMQQLPNPNPNPDFGVNQLLDSRFRTFNSLPQQGSNNKLPNIALSQKPELGCSKMVRSEIREYSSHCGSNQVAVDAADTSRASSCGFFGNNCFSSPAEATDVNNDHERKLSSQNEKGKKQETQEQTITSSSGGSGTSFGRTYTSNDSLKRKNRDAEDSECQSKAAILESKAARKKLGSKSGTVARKSRAAEVHNLSERKRRDRINEKMKALQELLPHSNKSDKASMLDEAIEYMKSLQLQLQMMWMGSGMAPWMFQHYMSRLGMGIGPPTLPLPNPMHFPPRLQPLLLDQNSINYQNQLQNSNFSDQYVQNYFGFHPMQNNSQPMNNIFGFGSNMSQQNQNNNFLAPPPPPPPPCNTSTTTTTTNNGLSAV